MKKILLILAALLVFTGAASAGYKFERSIQAPIDESFFGFWDQRNWYAPYVDPSLHPLKGSKGVRNAAYAWGVGQYKDEIWFGVLNNGWCGWIQSHVWIPYMNSSLIQLGPITLPGGSYLTNRQACSMNNHLTSSFQSKVNQVYKYNVKKGTIKTLNPANYDPGFGTALTTNNIIGIRAGGEKDELIFLTGLGGTTYLDAAGKEVKDADGNSYKSQGFLVVFLFDAEADKYLGSAKLPYDSIKRVKTFTHSDGSKAVYMVVGPDVTGGGSGMAKSHVLRWVGTKENPFKGGNLTFQQLDARGNAVGVPQETGFDIVGDLGEWGAGSEYELVDLPNGEKKLFVGVWSIKGRQKHPLYNYYFPTGGGADTPSSIMVSNAMPADGFTKENPATFAANVAFRMDEYEPDPLLKNLSEIGAMAKYGDYLYWGTMHIALTDGWNTYAKKYPEFYRTGLGLPVGDFTNRDLVKNTWRTMNLYRTHISTLQTELLYGHASEKVYKPDTKTWVDTPNQKGLKPLYGKSGFGAMLNIYDWTMAVHNGKLYVGTFDISGGIEDYFINYYDKLPEKLRPHGKTAGAVLLDIAKNDPDWKNGYKWGGDLFVFNDTKSAAEPVTMRGFGNIDNNGVRNANVVDGELYFGTSTFSNIGVNSGFEFYKVIETSLPTVDLAFPDVDKIAAENGNDNIYDGGIPNDPIFIPDMGGSSGGCSIGSGNDYMIAVLMFTVLSILVYRKFRKNKVSEIE